MLILVDPKTNANKFYSVTVSGDTVNIRYGRVGEEGTQRTISGGQVAAERQIAAKKRKGYKEAAVEGSAKAQVLRKDAATTRKAHADLAGDSKDPRLVALIERLVRQNAHEIKTLSGGKMTVRNGQVATPLGLLTVDAIDEATVLLNRLASDQKNANLLADYMTLVPQNVGRGRDWTESFFSGARTVDQQRAFLDQLRSSVQLAKTIDADGNASGDAKRAFAYSLAPVDDKSVIADIKKMFQDTRNSAHPSARMRVANIYATTSPASEASFDKVATTVGNVRRLWHGTRVHNVLSILATGMQVPTRNSGIHIAGRMFGDGIYFSEQSTKSLNYSRGGVWSSGIDSRALMFVADVAMGWEYRPNLHGNRSGVNQWNQVLGGQVADPKHGRTFTSISVRAGTGGVRSHEAVVPGPSYVALRYLVEFGE